MLLPHVTFYVQQMKEPFVGQARGPVILIRHDARHDKRLWMHEYEHVRQWYITIGTHGLLYLLIRRYRVWAEARGYAAQCRPDRSDLDALATWMAHPVYRLGMTANECRAQIERYLR